MPIKRSDNQRGFTLVELLIALVVVAIGMLEHAQMQLKSMRNAQRANFSLSANSALQDLAQRIRAMPNAALNSEFNYVYLKSADTAPVSESCNDDGVTCSRAEFAKYEVTDWFNNTVLYLPEPRFSIAQDSTVTNLFTVTLVWDADKSGWVGDASCDTSDTANQCAEINLWIR